MLVGFALAALAFIRWRVLRANRTPSASEIWLAAEQAGTLEPLSETIEVPPDWVVSSPTAFGASMATVSFSASADFGLTGQYIARLTGRNSKFTFEREFIGSKGGKRNEVSSAEVDDPGVYELRDVTRKGKADKYRVVIEFEGELQKLVSDKPDAMEICKALDAGRAFADIVHAGRNDEGKVYYEILSAAKAKQAGTSDAVAQCVALLQALEPAQQKAALKAIRAALAPAAEAAAPESAPEAQAPEQEG